MPKVISIQLKRFKTVFTKRGRVKRTKNTLLVKFDQKLKIVTSKGEQFFYELVSVVNHFGELNKGHYTAYGKEITERRKQPNQLNKGIWRLYDDEKVKVTHVNTVCSRNAYLLFYERMDILDGDESVKVHPIWESEDEGGHQEEEDSQDEDGDEEFDPEEGSQQSGEGSRPESGGGDDDEAGEGKGKLREVIDDQEIEDELNLVVSGLDPELLHDEEDGEKNEAEGGEKNEEELVDADAE